MKLKNNIISFIVIGAMGALFHFVYKWTGENYIIGFVFPVNESTWEHLKMIFYPTVIYSAFEYFILKVKTDNYLTATAMGIFAGKLTTVTLFYLYSGILGFNVDFLNIIIYYISIIVLLTVKNRIIKSEKYSSKNASLLSGIYLLLCAFLFAVWTYNPPSLGIFTPPII